MKHAHNFIDLTERKFGRWTVIKLFEGQQDTTWKCRCVCGVIKNVNGESLKRGLSVSCGCFRKEFLKKTKRKHGLSHQKFYNTFHGIRARCSNPKERCYYRYGGRGIKCLWKSFEEFRNDMYESYLEHVKKFGEKNTTIDRIDNNGNYSNKNCRWATHKEQCRNTRFNVFITFQNNTLCLKDWAIKQNINLGTLHKRFKMNWPIEKALTAPVKNFK